jgi:hypothetical protein
MFRTCLAAAVVSTCVFAVTAAQERKGSATPRESRIPVGGAELYFREIGQGTAIIVLHGGPDFDHSYLVPAWPGSPIRTVSSTTTSAVGADRQTV